MSREIKFRAWDSKEKRWAAHRIMPVLKGIIERLTLKDCLPISGKLIIEQYTGLKDKNGKEIYEGDIVKAKIQGLWETGPDTVCEGKATWNLEVVYNEIRYMDVFHILGSKNAPDTIYYLFEDKLSDIEVIGNIHENPELLEN